MMNFSNRINIPEIIDGNNYSETEYIQWLQQLHRVNVLTQGYYLSIQGLNTLLSSISKEQEVIILDLGCGGGDTLIEILKWNRHKKYRLRLIGVDTNESGLKIAAKKLRQENLTADLILDNGLEYIKRHSVDIILSSLFTHHLTDLQITKLLHSISSQAKLGFVINDLHRHWLPYFIMRVATKWTRANRLLQYDGPLSVARAFKKKDWEKYIYEANIPLNKVEISWHWSFRYSILYDNTI